MRAARCEGAWLVAIKESGLLAATQAGLGNYESGPFNKFESRHKPSYSKSFYILTCIFLALYSWFIFQVYIPGFVTSIRFQVLCFKFVDFRFHISGF